MFKECDVLPERISLDVQNTIEDYFDRTQTRLPNILADVILSREARHFVNAECVLREFDSKLITINKTLDRHLQVATLRSGLENSDRGAFVSLKLGLNHMYKRSMDKEFEGLRRKIKTLLLEFEILEKKALLDDVIIQLKLATGVSNHEGDEVPIMRR